MGTEEQVGHGPSRDEIGLVLNLISREARKYLDTLDDRPARVESSVSALRSPLPERGDGALGALRLLIESGIEASVASAGPRCFHFVIGGTTPAALGADWLASVLDQMAYAWVSSPLAAELESVSLSWLKDLFCLPPDWAGIMTTGATMANFVGLATARQWWGRRCGVDVAEEGLAGLPKVPVFSGGYIHASAIKALSMLGIGRSSVRVLSRSGAGHLAVGALEQALAELDGAPAILIGTAGEVNTGDFDPIATLADLAERYGAWLHVDGAFGLFARISPKTAGLIEGVERAHSVAVDGHKWLNVPYDCGFGFVSDAVLLGQTFAYTAAYLPRPDDPRPNFGSMGPESSRRARSLAVWATLRAYGREGHRRMVERHTALARRMARLVDEAPNLERLADVPLNIVCFRFNPGGLCEAELNRLNERVGEAILEDGRVYAGTTRFEEKVALRPAIVNWRTREADVDLFVAVVRELGARAAADLARQRAATEPVHDSADEGFAWQVGVWDKMADIYQKEIDARFGPVIEGVLARADLQPGQNVLDLGTGTGSLAFAAAAQVGATGRITAVDISPEMLAKARAGADARFLTSIDFVEGRAEAIPASDESQDAVLASLSLMYVIDRAAAAREIARVLRPGGRLVAAVWAGPNEADIVLFQQLAGSFAASPPVEGVGPGALADPTPFLGQLSEAGLKARVRSETTGFQFADFESAWNALAGVTTARLPARVQDQARSAVRRRMWSAADGPRQFRNGTHFIVASKPTDPGSRIGRHPSEPRAQARGHPDP